MGGKTSENIDELEILTYDGVRMTVDRRVKASFIPGYNPPALKPKAVVHGHWHQKAIFGINADQKVLKKMGLQAELLDSGCCGLAGSFGFEADHYDISMKIGERVLLPKVRQADSDTLIVADGFSCREQIMHGTPRQAMHLAEVIQMAFHQPLPQRKGKYVEAGFVEEEPTYSALAATGLGLLMASWRLFVFADAERKIEALKRSSFLSFVDRFILRQNGVSSRLILLKRCSCML